MKKIFAIIGLLALLFAVSCKSTNVSQTEADSYEPVEVGSENSEEQAQKSQSLKKDDGKIKSPKTNAFVNFFTSANKDIELDTTRLSGKAVSGKLKETEATIIYNVKTGLTGFSAWYKTEIYHVLFRPRARQAMAEAVSKYLEEFEAKELIRKTKQTYKRYGEYPVRLEWGSIPSMIMNYGNAYVQYGYEFKNKSPYFSITIQSIANDAYGNSITAIEHSVPLHFYFTKAQAQQMATLLSDESIEKALEPYRTVVNPEAAEKDSY
ncbi:MAG: hypothetical protein IJR49_05715 [Treponema sp.]|nr:hypothetical protein [Treponema sp.]